MEIDVRIIAILVTIQYTYANAILYAILSIIIDNNYSIISIIILLNTDIGLQ